jgi:iron complex outermembrane receptor protein
MKAMLGVMAGLGTVGLLAVPTVASAQQAAEGTPRLQEIIVTSERRESNVQDVPAAVSAFDPIELERRQVFNALDVMSNVPNLAVSNNPGQATSTTVFLRGIGSTESIVTLDTAIGFYLDDVYFARQGVNNLSMFDVERVEVLRGPQGTLYGRNTSGGAIRVMTKKPSEEFEAKAELMAGEYSSWSAKGSVNVPFTDKFFGRFNALVEQGDGYTKNVILNRDVNDRDNYGGRAAFRWLAADSVTVDLNYDYYRAETNGVYGFDIAGIVRPTAKNYFISSSGDETFSIGKTNGGALTVVWDINDTLELTSITAMRNIYQKWALDFTDQVVPIFKLWTINDTDQLTQEFRLSGSARDGRLKYVAGLYYYDETSYSFIGDQINLWPAPGVRVPLPFFRRYYDVDVKSYAAFAEASYDLTDKFTFTLGGRYTRDEKSLRIDQYIGGEYGFTPPGGIPGYNTASLEAAGIPMDLNDDDFSIKVGGQYRFTDDIMGYLNYSQGYKSGGWSARTNNPAEFVVFDPEYVDSYEAGLRTTMFDGRARLNYTAYYYDYTDFFATATGQDGNFIVATNDAEFYGFEFEGTARLTERLDAFTAIGWQDGKYKKQDETVGDEPQRLPAWTFKVGATYTIPVLDDDNLKFTVDYNFVEDYFTNLQNSELGRSGNVEIWNAVASYGIDNGKYEIFASCTNCFDNQYIAQSFDFAGIGFVQTYPGAPRWWMLGVRANW